MRRFKFLPSCPLSYEEQGRLWFTCRTFSAQPPGTKEKIKALCREAAGEHSDALLAYLTTDADWLRVCDRYFIGSSTLDRARREFYRLWGQGRIS